MYEGMVMTERSEVLSFGTKRVKDQRTSECGEWGILYWSNAMQLNAMPDSNPTEIPKSDQSCGLPDSFLDDV